MSTQSHILHTPPAGRPRWRALLLALCGMALLAAPAAPTLATPGSLDEWGGHFDGSNGRYHYHKPSRNLALKRSEHLNWKELDSKGTLVATFHRQDRPNAIWVHVPNRPAYHTLSRLISAANRDDGNMLIQVWFRYVSPEETGRRGKTFYEWYKKKVIFETHTKLSGQELMIHFDISPVVKRMRGMVFVNEENINLWMVLSGWSYYLLEDGENTKDENPHHDLFIQAEDSARRNKKGLWSVQ